MDKDGFKISKQTDFTITYTQFQQTMISSLSNGFYLSHFNDFRVANFISSKSIKQCGFRFSRVVAGRMQVGFWWSVLCNELAN